MKLAFVGFELYFAQNVYNDKKIHFPLNKSVLGISNMGKMPHENRVWMAP